jgi:thiopurine S-methyltransferase
MQGPPFSIDRRELTRIFGAKYEIIQLASTAMENGFRGMFPARETVWLLH